MFRDSDDTQKAEQKWKTCENYTFCRDNYQDKVLVKEQVPLRDLENESALFLGITVS
jgi:hypothetical protein